MKNGDKNTERCDHIIFVAKRIKKSLAVDIGIRKTYFNMPREVYASRGISIMAINTCGDCQMKGSVRYEQR